MNLIELKALAESIVPVLLAYIALKKDLVGQEKRLRNHTDVGFARTNGSLTYIMLEMPWPIYIVKLSYEEDKIKFRMMELNELYAKIYDISRIDWHGKTDIEAGMPKKLAQEEYSRYVEVWSTRKKKIYLRTMPDGSQEIYQQIPFADNEGKVVGVMCYAIGKCRKLFNRECQNLNLEPKVQGTYQI